MAKRSDIKKKIKEESPQPYIPPEIHIDNSKQDAVAALKEHGYDAFIEDGVVMVSFEHDGDAKKVSRIMDAIECILAEVGYNRSFGCRARRTADG